MRSLKEILEGARDGNKPSYDECYFAMLVLSNLYSMEFSAVNELCNSSSTDKKKVTHTESIQRNKKAFDVAPDELLNDNVPGNPDYDRMRKASKAVLSRIFNI